MKAIVITQPGEPAVLQLKDYETPVPENDEVLIDVKAAGLNRADIAQRQGNYPAPPGVPADIPGLEIAGIVAACGPAVTMWKPGDRICALLAGGGYATQVKVREGQCLPIPENLHFAAAAALPEALFTVWSNVFQRGQLKAGENFLVHGGSSGIGITAIQLGAAFGARVFTTVGTDEKGRDCMAYGCQRYINYKTQDFEKELKDTGIDVILDMVGGDYLKKNINILKPDGRIVYINAMDKNPAVVPIHQMMVKRATITGSTLRSREYSFKKALAEEVHKNIWPLITTGKFQPVIFNTFPLKEAAAAHQLMETSSHTGKIILTVE